MIKAEIKIMLDRYYSGDISPEEHETLISELKDMKATTELETERKMLIALASCEPVIPEDLEKRLINAIDKRARRLHYIIKTVLSSAAAAIVLICITFGIPDDSNSGLSDPECATRTHVSRHKTTFAKTDEAAETMEALQATVSKDNTTIVKTKKSHLQKVKDKSSITDTKNNELDIASQKVDDALLDIIAGIRISQNEIAESMEEIHINQEIDLNIL